MAIKNEIKWAAIVGLSGLSLIIEVIGCIYNMLYSVTESIVMEF